MIKKTLLFTSYTVSSFNPKTQEAKEVHNTHSSELAEEIAERVKKLNPELNVSITQEKCYSVSIITFEKKE